MANILICDDSGLIRLQLKTILEEEGHNVFETVNLKQIKLNAFGRDMSLVDMDLLFLDIYLSDGTGFEVLNYLTEKYSNLPIIMVSGDNKKESIMKAFDLGAHDYILKPLNKVSLLKKLNTFLNKAHSKKNNSNSSDKENFADNIKSFKHILSLEMNRTIRSKLSFTISKLQFDKKIKIDINRIKGLFIDNIREIDYLCTISDDVLLLLLPLTDIKGFEVLNNRVNSLYDSSIQNLDTMPEISVLSFPVDICEEPVFEDIEEYVAQILKKLSVKKSNP